MVKIYLFCILSVMFVCSISHADLLFTMNTEGGQTELLPGEQVTVTLSAMIEGESMPGLFAWGLDAIVDLGGVVEVVDGTIGFLPSDTWNDTDSGWDPLGLPTGSISNLHAVGLDGLIEGSTIGVDVYTPVAQFDIRAIGSVGQSVSYELGGDSFMGVLVDYSDLPGQFVADGSDNVFTIVPEPASLLILSGLSVLGVLRRKK
ncbi:MAG: PEP-CTERM sorting domain-containing protein [Planctomycetota bacterium]